MGKGKQLEGFIDFIRQASEVFKALRSGDNKDNVIYPILSQPNFFLIYLTYQLHIYSKRLDRLTIGLLALTFTLMVLTVVLTVIKW